MSEPGSVSDAPPAIAAEVERQVAEILRGAAFGDESTRRTMERELRERLTQSLRDEKPLRVYLGVDPTAPDLHLGHCVSLRKLHVFQELGHHAILLIGDFTGLVGDPSDKDSARPMQAEEILARNAQTYQEQAFKLLDPDRTEVRRNSEWLATLTFADVIRLASHFTVAQFIERDTFRNRLDRGEPVYVHEFMYGLMQGYDAVALEADVQIGGTDQTFNLMAGRTLQRVYEQPPQVAVTYPILVGTDGALRMSKSTGNYIGIDEPPDEQYGKAMSVPDHVLVDYFTLGTNLSGPEIDALAADLASGSLHPMDAKKRLAHAIVAEWHGADAADAAEARFERVHEDQQAPQDMPTYPISGGTTVSLPVVLTESGLVGSRREVKRLVSQGGVYLNGQRVHDLEIPCEPNDVLSISRRKWLRLVQA